MKNNEIMWFNLGKQKAFTNATKDNIILTYGQTKLIKEEFKYNTKKTNSLLLVLPDCVIDNDSSDQL